MKTARIVRQSDNKHQWFIEVRVDKEFKIEKVFYNKEDCTKYMKSRKD